MIRQFHFPAGWTCASHKFAGKLRYQQLSRTLGSHTTNNDEKNTPLEIKQTPIFQKQPADQLKVRKSYFGKQWKGDAFRYGVCRTRFAPSPTGYLHLGSLRTALFNYLLARATGGQFIIRIEDTDRSRLVADAEERLYRDLKWAGLDWDEGPDVGGIYGPYRQSDRLDIYHRHVDKLIHDGKAYRCFCSPRDLEQQKRQSSLSRHYPGTCLSLSPEESQRRANAGESHAVRFKSRKLPARPVRFEDLVYGTNRKSEYEEDFIILKRDRFPTFHFASVVDDQFMRITHVIRGVEWLLSTPKHVELYEAMGWTPPKFVHVPLLVDSQGQKLSKRHPSVSLDWYKEHNILPETLLNYCYLHGKRSPNRNELIHLQGMIEAFDLNFTKGNVTVMPNKLAFLQQGHVQDLLQGSPSGAKRLREFLLKPIDAIVQQMEVKRAAGEEGFDAYGPLVPAMRSDVPEQDRLDYIKKTLDACGPHRGLKRWIEGYKHFFWRIPRATLKNIFASSPQFTKVVYLDANPTTADPSAQAAIISPSQAFYRIRSVLESAGQVDEPDKPALIKSANLIGTRIVAMPHAPCLHNNQETESGRAQKSVTVGYQFLRWALLALQGGPGAGLTVAGLGRGEVLRRLETAEEVAREVPSAAQGAQDACFQEKLKLRKIYAA